MPPQPHPAPPHTQVPLPTLVHFFSITRLFCSSFPRTPHLVHAIWTFSRRHAGPLCSHVADGNLTLTAPHFAFALSCVAGAGGRAAPGTAWYRAANREVILVNR